MPIAEVELGLHVSGEVGGTEGNWRLRIADLSSFANVPRSEAWLISCMSADIEGGEGKFRLRMAARSSAVRRGLSSTALRF